MHNKTSGFDIRREISLCLVNVNRQLAVVFFVGIGFVHSASGRSAGNPINKCILADACNVRRVISRLACDFDDSLIVGDFRVGRQIENNRLKLCADFIAHTLCVIHVQLCSGSVIGRTAERVKAVAFKLIKRRLMCRCIGSAVSAAGECGFSRYFKRCISFPCNKVVVFQRRCRRYGLRIEQRSIVIQAYIE